MKKETKPEDPSPKTSKKVKPYPVLDEQEKFQMTTGKNKIGYDRVKKGEPIDSLHLRKSNTLRWL